MVPLSKFQRATNLMFMTYADTPYVCYHVSNMNRDRKTNISRERKRERERQRHRGRKRVNGPADSVKIEAPIWCNIRTMDMPYVFLPCIKHELRQRKRERTREGKGERDREVERE